MSATVIDVHDELATAKVGPPATPAPSGASAGGCESLRAIAAGLEERGIPAARGCKWSAVQVARLLEDRRQQIAPAFAQNSRWL
jgi:hypothetical protein